MMTDGYDRPHDFLSFDWNQRMKENMVDLL